MKKFYTSFFNLPSQAGILIPPSLNFSVTTISKRAIGGFYRSEIEVSGDEHDLLWLINSVLGKGCKVYDENAQTAFIGFVGDIEIRLKRSIFRVNLDQMFNSVACRYQEVVGGVATGYDKVTSFIEDQDSIEKFGRKQFIIDKEELTEDQAVLIRDRYFNQVKEPVVRVEPVGSSANEDAGATVRVYGLFETLGWMYYKNEHGIITNQDSKNISDMNIGDVPKRLKIAQRFTVGNENLNCNNISVKLEVEGEPDSMYISLFDDNNGVPGNLIDSITVTPPLTLSSGGWLETGLSGTLTANTNYWIVFVPWLAGTDNYYITQKDTEAKLGGWAKRYDGNENEWVSMTGKDVVIKVSGVKDTALQVVDMAETGKQSFFSKIINEIGTSGLSGVEILHYRDGSKTVLEEILELVETGTANSRRILCNVDENLSLRFYEEPEKPDQRYSTYSISMGLDVTKNRVMVERYTLEAGKWAKYVLDNIGDPALQNINSQFLIEEIEYSVSDESLTMTEYSTSLVE